MYASTRRAWLVLAFIAWAHAQTVSLPIDYAGQVKNKPALDPRDFGAKCDGVTNDYTAWTAAIGVASGATIQLPAGSTCVIGAWLTIPPSVGIDFSGGGSLQPSAGVTIAIQGPIIAPPRQIFRNALASGGTISFDGNTSISEAYPQWWGATGDGRHDDTACLNALFNSLATIRNPVPPYGQYPTVDLGGKVYYITGTVMIENFRPIRMLYGTFLCDGLGWTGPCVNMRGSRARWYDVAITTPAEANTNPTHRPQVGLAIYRTAAGGGAYPIAADAGANWFYSGGVSGAFQKAAIYSIASEEDHYINFTMNQRADGAPGYYNDNTDSLCLNYPNMDIPSRCGGAGQSNTLHYFTGGEWWTPSSTSPASQTFHLANGFEYNFENVFTCAGAGDAYYADRIGNLRIVHSRQECSSGTNFVHITAATQLSSFVLQNNFTTSHNIVKQEPGSQLLDVMINSNGDGYDGKTVYRLASVSRGYIQVAGSTLGILFDCGGTPERHCGTPYSTIINAPAISWAAYSDGGSNNQITDQTAETNTNSQYNVLTRRPNTVASGGYGWVIQNNNGMQFTPYLSGDHVYSWLHNPNDGTDPQATMMDLIWNANNNYTLNLRGTTGGFSFDGSTGISGSIVVKNSAGGNCTITISGGIITASTC